MSKHILFLVLSITLSGNKLLGQDAAVANCASILKNSNEKIASIKNGKFAVTYKFKSVTNEDTTKINGTCYFYKNANESVSNFIIFINNEPAIIYKANRFYEIYPVQKKIVYTNIIASDISKVLRGNLNRHLIYAPFLLIKQNVFSEDFINNSIIEDKNIYTDSNYYCLVSKNVDSKNLVSNPQVSVLINKKTLFVNKIFDELDFENLHQYKEYNFSDIEDLGFLTCPEFNLDELLLKYSVSERNGNIIESERDSGTYKVGSIAPNFEVLTTTGKIINSKQTDARLLLLDFWYKSCYPCLKLSPIIEKINKEYALRGLQTIGINPYDYDPKDLTNFLEKRDINYNIAIDSLRKITNEFRVILFPSVFLIDTKTNKILWLSNGYSDAFENDLTEKLNSLLN